MKTHYNNWYYNPRLRDHARKLRSNSTPMEIRIWKYVLSRKKLGYRFKRQRPIGNYIVDFFCKELRLIIEIDGFSHEDADQSDYDLRRRLFLEGIGLTVLRYSDKQVSRELYRIKEELEMFIEHFENE